MAQGLGLTHIPPIPEMAQLRVGFQGPRAQFRNVSWAGQKDSYKDVGKTIETQNAVQGLARAPPGQT